MKKAIRRILKLNAETIGILRTSQIGAANGGLRTPACGTLPPLSEDVCIDTQGNTPCRTDTISLFCQPF